jgi:hypothetical protein
MRSKKLILGIAAVIVMICSPLIGAEWSPLPGDLKIDMPGPEVPPKISAYSGIWQGVATCEAWKQSTNIQVVLERVHLSGAKLIFSWRGSSRDVKDGWQRVEGNFDGHQISANIVPKQRITLRVSDNGKYLYFTWSKLGCMFMGTLSR